MVSCNAAFLVRSAGTVAIAAFLAMLPAPAEGSSICIRLVAEVATVDDENSLLEGAIVPGALITASYRYESTAPDSNSASTVGDYWYTAPPNGISVQAGGFDFRTDPSNVDFLLEMTNNHNIPPTDVYNLRSYNNLSLSNGVLVDHIHWQLDDYGAAAISNANLPTTPPVLADWPDTWVGLTLEGSDPADDSKYYFVRTYVQSATLCSDAGAVPDGRWIAGVPVKVEKRAFGEIFLEWGASCMSSDTDYEVYEGGLGSFTSHRPVVCSTGGLTSATIPTRPRGQYYLVVPTTGSVEGSYGRNKAGVERPASSLACAPRSIGSCP